MRDERPVHDHEVNHVISRTRPMSKPLRPREALSILFVPLFLVAGIVVWTLYSAAPVHPGLLLGLVFYAVLAGLAVVPGVGRTDFDHEAVSRQR